MRYQIISLILILISFSSCEIGTKETIESTDSRPCLGDPCYYPTLARQRVSGISGARFGKVRNGGTRQHNGLDLKMTEGSDLFAMYDSYIYDIREDDVGGWGRYIICLTTHRGKRIFIMYAHIRKAKVRVGEFVKAGDLIAISGDTGNVDEAVEQGYTSLHLHLEVREMKPGVPFRNCKALDPEDFLGSELNKNGRPISKRPCHDP